MQLTNRNMPMLANENFQVFQLLNQHYLSLERRKCGVCLFLGTKRNKSIPRGLSRIFVKNNFCRDNITVSRTKELPKIFSPCLVWQICYKKVVWCHWLVLYRRRRFLLLGVGIINLYSTAFKFLQNIHWMNNLQVNKMIGERDEVHAWKTNGAYTKLQVQVNNMHQSTPNMPTCYTGFLITESQMMKNLIIKPKF